MPAPLPRLAFGGDYNPEQWPVEVQGEDVRLMREAGVDLVTLAVFAWAHLQPGPGAFSFGWLDDVVERLHEGGIRVDMATATASPPPWLTTAYPEMLPVTADGTRLWPGGRQAFCPSSPVYLDHALALCGAMAGRYGGHDALALWHVGNELGAHNVLCYCDVSAAAFRTWLLRRYGDLDALNEAWGTAFWSQRYTDIEQVLPPRTAAAFRNPTQQLDFQRFSSDQIVANFVAERDLLHELSPGVPVTTNFMVMDGVRQMDYYALGGEVDLVSQDFYLVGEDPEGHRELAFCSDWTRGTARGRPWLLMEQSTSAVNWQPRNIAKRPGELLRNSLAHVARGGDGVLFFQWRASRAGAEKFHSGLVPHAGTDTRLWREVVELSRVLDRIEEVAGSASVNRVALVLDWNARWASELDAHPSADLSYLDQARSLHAALTDLGVGVDVVHPDSELTGYDLVLVPTLYLVTDAAAQSIKAAAAGGATVLVTYFSGIVDEHDHIRLGGYPGAFRDMLGVRVQELLPLRAGEVVSLSDGTTADLWAEHVDLAGAEAVASFVDGPAPGGPALTRHRVGDGTAWYAATRLEPAALRALVARLVEESGVEPVAPGRPGVELLRRTAADGRSWVFAINHTTEAVTVEVTGRDLVADAETVGALEVPAEGVAVVREG